jgi:hypothetical protein
MSARSRSIGSMASLLVFVVAASAQDSTHTGTSSIALKSGFRWWRLGSLLRTISRL